MHKLISKTWPNMNTIVTVPVIHNDAAFSHSWRCNIHRIILKSSYVQRVDSWCWNHDIVGFHVLGYVTRNAFANHAAVTVAMNPCTSAKKKIYSKDPSVIVIHIQCPCIITHWGRVTHICVGKLTTIDSDIGLSPGRRQAIIWTNVGMLLIGPLGTNFSEILIGIQIFSFKKIHLKMSSGKWRPSSPGLNVLTIIKMVNWYRSDRFISAVHNLLVRVRIAS